MNNFFKLLFASCLGSLLAFGALLLLGVLSVTSLVSAFGEDTVDVEANSVLVIDPTLVPELTDNLPSSPFEIDRDPVLGLQRLREVIAEAADDDDIKGILLDIDQAAVAPATALALRQALEGFRESGKFVLSHAKYYGQGAYYIASVADGLYLNPTGGLDIRGYGSTQVFVKNALDKAGIDMQVFYAGDFKSAGEIFMRTEMSDSNRLQTREYLTGLWDIWVQDVAASRNIPEDKLRNIADEFLARDDEDALAYDLVDALYYKDQVIDEFKRRLGLDEDDKIKTVSAADYSSTLPRLNLTAKKKIAVVYAEGGIVDGKGDLGAIGDAKYARVIRKIRQDDKVKGIVLRVNSGGGSAMASENIWRELKLAQEAGIPVVTSMGDVAASGGYYIATATDSIFAEPNTITGSIGVIGVIPNFSELMTERIGVTFDTVNTGEYSNAFSTVFPFTAGEEAIIQESIEDVYEHFVNRVAEGRNLSEARVKQLAKGRVYTGERALELDLVDALGGLDEAIAAVGRMADLDLDDVRISEYPKIKSPEEQLIAQFTGGDDEPALSLMHQLLRAELGDGFDAYLEAKSLLSCKGPQMRMTERLSIR